MNPSDTDTEATEQEFSDARTLSLIERYFGFSTWKFFAAVFGVIVAAFYISKLLFGNASLEVLMRLDRYEQHLSAEIDRLKQQNAQLQKAYFELKELEPKE